MKRTQHVAFQPAGTYNGEEDKWIVFALDADGRTHDRRDFPTEAEAVAYAQSRTKYTAHVGGSSWSRGPTADFNTLSECREFAESYGTTADWCQVRNKSGKVVADYRRDTGGPGTRWYKATI